MAGMSENIKIKKEYYKSLDIIRNVSCFAVLFYHLDILKGGCLAVCSFFTLSGYLSCITNFNKRKFSFFKYYKNRFIKIYIPIVITVFATIFTISFFKNIKAVNLKPEVASILLGYNNFWQLSVKHDYFSTHINSPFMHFWYMAILLQFELVFPFVFVALKKNCRQVKRRNSCHNHAKPRNNQRDFLLQNLLHFKHNKRILQYFFARIFLAARNIFGILSLLQAEFVADKIQQRNCRKNRLCALYVIFILFVHFR